VSVASVGVGIYFGGCIIIISLALSSILAIILMSATKPDSEEAKQRLKNSQETLASLKEVWLQQASDSAFRFKLGEFEKLREEYRELPAFRQRKLASLDAGRRNAQLEAFLDRHRIEKAKLPGISSGRTATLQSFGVETALDIIKNDILQVPGFGPVLTDTLLNWRRYVESKFVFDTSRGIDPADVAALDRSVSVRKDQIEQILLAGVAELEKIKHQTVIRRQAFFHQLEAAAKAVAQAEADFRVL
jgi:DNA-binding helix-hairpin-helix protein with protein kinase domain